MSRQTLSPARIVIAEQTPGPVVAKESVGATTSSTRTGRPYLILHSLLNSCVSVLFIFFFFFKHCLFPLKLSQSSDHPWDWNNWSHFGGKRLWRCVSPLLWFCLFLLFCFNHGTTILVPPFL